MTRIFGSQRLSDGLWLIPVAALVLAVVGFRYEAEAAWLDCQAPAEIARAESARQRLEIARDLRRLELRVDQAGEDLGVVEGAILETRRDR